MHHLFRIFDAYKGEFHTVTTTVTDENGNQHFTPIEQPKPSAVDNRSWWQKVCDWWNDAPVKPYVKVRNLSDPFGD